MKKFKILSLAMLAVLTGTLLCSTALALPPSSEEIYAGIDVSKWQGRIDFTEAAGSGIEIVYIRISAGSDYEDPYFEQNYADARAAGLKIGFYHSMTAGTEQEALVQADFFFGLIAGKTYDCRPAMDYGYRHNITAAQANINALAFLSGLENKTSESPVIYTDASGARDVWDSGVASKSLLWVAEYGASTPEDNGKWENWVGWQYSDTGRVPGISGNVDLDHFTSDILLDTPATVPGDKIPIPPPDKKLIRITVRPGDTLSRLALEYETTVQSLVKLNGIKNPDRIYAGQLLFVRVDSGHTLPCAGSYTVRAGDTLWRLAGRFDTTVNRLAALNKIRNPNRIYIGEILDLGVCTQK